jgi:hypothetical protein
MNDTLNAKRPSFHSLSSFLAFAGVGFLHACKLEDSFN